MLICYHGTDTYRLREAAAGTAATMRKKLGDSLHVASVDCEDTDAADTLERHIKYPSFFGDSKLVIATNAASPAVTDLLSRFRLQDISDVTVVAIQDTSRKGVDKKCLSFILSNAAEKEEFKPLTGTALTAWVASYCSRRGSVIRTDAAALLIQRIGSDSGRLASELDKLCAYAGPEPIGTDAVTTLTPQTYERDEWELSNALSSHDKRAIVSSLWKSLQAGTPEQLLIGSLASGLRNLLIIRDLADRKHAPAVIAKRAGLHPFIVSKSLRGASTADVARLRAAHIAVARLDRDIKEGMADATDGMFSVVLSL